MTRKPRNYVGTNHQTIGSDILAIVRALPLPRQLLGAELMSRLDQVKPDGWYPISLLLEPLDVLAERVGQFGLLAVGRKLFQLSHAAAVKANATCAGDIIHGIDGMYHRANRGADIGGWQVLRFVPGEAELEKTTPHHCVMEEGILGEALTTIGVPALVQQTACFRKGAEACRYVISSAISDEKWLGKYPITP